MKSCCIICMTYAWFTTPVGLQTISLWDYWWMTYHSRLYSAITSISRAWHCSNMRQRFFTIRQCGTTVVAWCTVLLFQGLVIWYFWFIVVWNEKKYKYILARLSLFYWFVLMKSVNNIHEQKQNMCFKLTRLFIRLVSCIFEIYEDEESGNKYQEKYSHNSSHNDSRWGT